MLLRRRVLIFLEAGALGRAAPTYAAHLAEELFAAARTLKLRSLEVLLLVGEVADR